MAEPADMILPLLREMRTEMNQRFDALTAEHKQGQTRVEARPEKLESTLESFRHALTADSLLSKLVTGESEERIELLERKVRELERLK